MSLFFKPTTKKKEIRFLVKSARNWVLNASERSASRSGASNDDDDEPRIWDVIVLKELKYIYICINVCVCIKKLSWKKFKHQDNDLR